MSSFGGLIIGNSAIHAAQRGLDITGQNIANSATPGYTRQRVDLESVGGPGVPAFWSRYLGSGEGVKVTGITRMNDDFLVARARNSNAALGNLEERAKTYAAIERTVSEPGTNGLQKQLADFWNAWGKISTSPHDAAPRNLTYERAVAVAGQLNHMSDSVTTQWADTRTELQANVDAINTMAEDVAALNRAIRNNNIAKVPSNELLDKRDSLISEIAKMTGATVRPAEVDVGADFASQAVDVYIGDVKLVDGMNASRLKLDAPDTNPTGLTDQAQVQWEDDSSDAGIVTGNLSGQLTALNTTLPSYLKQFDDVAAKLALTVNDQQAAGYTVDGSPGGDLFAADGGGTVTAANISVVGTAADLAVSEQSPPALDGNNAMYMARHLGDKNGADADYANMVVHLGVEAQSVNRNVEVQANVVKQAEDARDNVSGVSLNEEMTNLIQFQHSFAAAARFVSVIDQSLETLINMVR